MDPPARPAFRCPRCRRVSHHPDDAANGYCGACHAFTGGRPAEYDRDEALRHLRRMRHAFRRRFEVAAADEIAKRLGPSLVQCLPDVPPAVAGEVLLALSAHLAGLAELGLTKAAVVVNVVGALADDLLSGADDDPGPSRA